MNAIDNFIFIVLPYISLAVFLVGSIYRYRSTSFKFSSLSSQFLEGRTLFWGSIPFHWGILFLFFGHLIAFLIPQGVLAWNSHPLRLIILEVTAFIFALSVLFGLLYLIIRRITHPRLRVVSNYMDIVILLLLLMEVVTGLGIAYGLRWGSSWFAAVLTPYLRSVFVLQPEIEAVSALPWPVKLHIAGAFTIVLLIPFSRLVHFLVPPINYAWRPYQVVTWYWERKKVRSPKTSWTMTQPKNT